MFQVSYEEIYILLLLQQSEVFHYSRLSLGFDVNVRIFLLNDQANKLYYTIKIKKVMKN